MHGRSVGLLLVSLLTPGAPCLSALLETSSDHSYSSCPCYALAPGSAMAINELWLLLLLASITLEKMPFTCMVQFGPLPPPQALSLLQGWCVSSSTGCG